MPTKPYLLAALLTSCCHKGQAPDHVYVIDGQRMQVLEAVPSTIMRGSQGECEPRGQRADRYTQALSEFSRARLTHDVKGTPVIVSNAPYSTDDDGSGLARRTINAGELAIGIDPRSEQGVVVVSGSWGVDFYCVEIIPGGHIVLDLFQSHRS